MGYISVAIIVLIVLDVCVLYFMCRYIYHRNLTRHMMDASEKEAQNLYLKIDDIYKESQILRHDLKHYLTVVLGLMINEEYDEAKKQIVDVIGTKFNGGYIYYQGSSVINAVLNDKRSVCEACDISLELVVSGDVPMYCEMDLAIILANLIDNAIEAAKKEERKYIKVVLLRDKGMYAITVSNYISQSVLQSNPRLQSPHTSDKNKKHTHGFGIKSIQKLVKRLDGLYQYYEEHDMFCSYVSVPFNGKIYNKDKLTGERHGTR